MFGTKLSAIYGAHSKFNCCLEIWVAPDGSCRHLLALLFRSWPFGQREVLEPTKRHARPTLAIVAATWPSRSALPNHALVRPAIDFQHLLQRVPSLLRTGCVLAGLLCAHRSSTASKRDAAQQQRCHDVHAPSCCRRRQAAGLRRAAGHAARVSQGAPFAPCT